MSSPQAWGAAKRQTAKRGEPEVHEALEAFNEEREKLNASSGGRLGPTGACLLTIQILSLHSVLSEYGQSTYQESTN